MLSLFPCGWRRMRKVRLLPLDGTSAAGPACKTFVYLLTPTLTHLILDLYRSLQISNLKPKLYMLRSLFKPRTGWILWSSTYACGWCCALQWSSMSQKVALRDQGHPSYLIIQSFWPLKKSSIVLGRLQDILSVIDGGLLFVVWDGLLPQRLIGEYESVGYHERQFKFRLAEIFINANAAFPFRIEVEQARMVCEKCKRGFERILYAHHQCFRHEEALEAGDCARQQERSWIEPRDQWEQAPHLKAEVISKFIVELVNKNHF